MADLVLVVVLLLLVPAVFFAGRWSMRVTLQQPYRDTRSMADMAERTRVLAARRHGHWGGSEETGAW